MKKAYMRQTEKRTPILQEETARSMRPAPKFWALMAEIEALIAMTGIKAKLLNLPTAPTPAEAVTPPIIFTMAVINIKEILVTLF